MKKNNIKKGNNKEANGMMNYDASTDERQDIVEVKRRGAYWNCRPLGYRQLMPFLEYKDEIDSHLDKIFAGEIDSNNGDCLDNMIRDISAEAVNYLLRQRVVHEDEIQKGVNRLQGDKKAYESELKALNIKLDEIYKWLETYKKLQRKDEILEEV